MALPYYLRIEIDALLQDIGATIVFWYSDSTPKPTEGNENTLYIRTDLNEISTWSGSEYSSKSLDLSVYTPNGGNINDTAQTLRDDINENETAIQGQEIRIGEIEGLGLFANQANQEIYIRNASGTTLSTLSVAFLNNEGTTFFYNETTEKLELRNDEGTVLSEVPVGAFVSNLAATLALSGNKLSLKDREGNEVSFVEFEISNINGLQAALEQAEQNAKDYADSLDTSKEVKEITNTTQYTVIASDVDKVLDFTANAGEEINLIINTGVIPANKSIQFVSSGNNVVIPVAGSGVTLAQTEGSKLKSKGKGSFVEILSTTVAETFSVTGDLEVYENIYNNFKPFILKFQGNANDVVKLPTVNADNINDFQIDWGDGISERYDNTQVCEHTYSTSGIFEIKIKGRLDWFFYEYNSTELGKDKLIEIVQWGDIEWKNIKFTQCVNLSLIPASEAPNFLNVNSLHALFHSCNLTEIPVNLLRNAQNVTYLGYAFEKNNISSIDSDLFKYCLSAVDFTRIFQDNQISEVPSSLFKNSVNALSFMAAFRGNPITNIDESIFWYNINAESFESTFYDCDILSIPLHLFKYNDKVTNFKECFRHNYNTTGRVPELWMRYPDAISVNCFQHSSSVDNASTIPDSWGRSFTGSYGKMLTWDKWIGTQSEYDAQSQAWKDDQSIIKFIGSATRVNGVGGSTPIQNIKEKINPNDIVAEDIITPPIDTPTFDGSGQTVHPSVIYIPEGLSGYKYWMAHTPYPGSDSDFEIPSILASNDRINWELPEGAPDPLVEPNPDGQHADCTMFRDKDGTLYIHWFKQNHGLIAITSQDGINWSEEILIEDNYGGVSPTIFWDENIDKYVMYLVNNTDFETYRILSDSPLSFDPNEQELCNTSNLQDGWEIWHSEIRKFDNLYLAILNTRESGLTYNYRLDVAISYNGIDFTVGDNYLLYKVSGSWNQNKMYKASALKLSNDKIALWYGGRSGPSNEWRIAYTELSIKGKGTENIIREYGFALSDEDSDLIANNSEPVYTDYIPFSIRVREIFINVGKESPAGNKIEIDLWKNGESVFEVKPSIDPGEFTSANSSSPQKLLTGNFKRGDKIEVFITEVGTTNTGRGLKAKVL